MLASCEISVPAPEITTYQSGDIGEAIMAINRPLGATHSTRQHGKYTEFCITPGNLTVSSDRVKASVAVDGVDSVDAAMYLTDETLGGGTPDLKSQELGGGTPDLKSQGLGGGTPDIKSQGLGGGTPDIESQLERFFEQSESYRGSEANYWMSLMP